MQLLVLLINSIHGHQNISESVNASVIEPDAVVRAYNPSTQETESGESPQDEAQPGLLSSSRPARATV